MKRSIVISFRNVCYKVCALTVTGILTTGIFYFDIPNQTLESMAKEVIEKKETNIFDRINSLFSLKLEDSVMAALPYKKTVVLAENQTPEPAPVIAKKPEPKAEEKPINNEPTPQSVNYSNDKSSNAVSNNGIIVKNIAGKQFDINALLNKKLNYNPKTGGYKVLIVHSHTTESYFPTDRNQNPALNMVRVGDEITKVLEENGIKTLHITKVHDSPYTYSYKNALQSVTSALAENPSIEVVVDVHRDALSGPNKEKLKPVANINGEAASQVMVLTGTNEGGLPHPNWAENLSFALKIQNQMINNYKGLARPVNLSKERYNTHTTKSSIIFEVGANGNTLEEAIVGGRYAAQAMANVLNGK